MYVAVHHKDFFGYQKIKNKQLRFTAGMTVSACFFLEMCFHFFQVMGLAESKQSDTLFYSKDEI